MSDHLLGQRRVQVSEKATGDLLVFIFFLKISLKLSHSCESEFFFTTFCVVLFYSMQFLKWGIGSTRKMWLVSTSEMKAGKEQVDHEVKPTKDEKLLLWSMMTTERQGEIDEDDNVGN